MPRILLADDEQSFTDVYQELLEDEGFQVEVANDGHSALKAISEGGYDLILLDIIMPEMDGVSILKKIQEKPPTMPNGPIVMLTVLEETDFIKTCLTHGASNYINKSSGTPEEIAQRIKNLIEKTTS